MTIDQQSDSPRWGGVARRPDNESRDKPQQISGSDFQTSQVHAGSSVNDSGTCEKSDTPLTQQEARMFAARSAIGTKFGRLTVIGVVRKGKGKSAHIAWECRCDCGNVIIARQNNVRSGHTASCSCLNRDRVSETHRRHGMSYHPAYINWQTMIQRCENPKVPHYHRYGGRGIGVCERWKTWENFYADMGERPSPQHSIDRIDNDKGYEPGNCRWATRAEQLLNTRRSIARRERLLAAAETDADVSIIELGRQLVVIGRNDPRPAIQSRARIIARNCSELEVDPDRPGLRQLTLNNIHSLSAYRASAA